MNCQSCVVANELRRRGLDVEARPRVRGLYNEQFRIAQNETMAWETVDGKRPRPVSSGRILESVKPQDALSEITQDVGRYFVTVYWKKFPDGSGGGGHIFTAERLKGGALRLYDPQSGKTGSLSGGGGFEWFWKKMSPLAGFRVLRVDNLKLKSRLNLRQIVRGNQEKT